MARCHGALRTGETDREAEMGEGLGQREANEVVMFSEGAGAIRRSPARSESSARYASSEHQSAQSSTGQPCRGVTGPLDVRASIHVGFSAGVPAGQAWP